MRPDGSSVEEEAEALQWMLDGQVLQQGVPERSMDLPQVRSTPLSLRITPLSLFVYVVETPVALLSTSRVRTTMIGHLEAINS